MSDEETHGHATGFGTVDSFRELDRFNDFVSIETGHAVTIDAGSGGLPGKVASNVKFKIPGLNRNQVLELVALWPAGVHVGDSSTGAGPPGVVSGEYQATMPQETGAFTQTNFPVEFTAGEGDTTNNAGNLNDGVNGVWRSAFTYSQAVSDADGHAPAVMSSRGAEARPVYFRPQFGHGPLAFGEEDEQFASFLNMQVNSSLTGDPQFTVNYRWIFDVWELEDAAYRDVQGRGT